MAQVLAVVGSRKFYDYGVFETLLDAWVAAHGLPARIICGGAAGVDALAERWADNHNVPYAVFSEAWNAPRSGLEDQGRKEAPTSLTNELLSAATHIIAFPSPTSKWTEVVIEMAEKQGIPCRVIRVD